MNKTQKRPLISEQDIDDALMLRRGYVQECEARIAALEAENAALREFVAAYDETFLDLEPGATNLAAIAEEHRLRQRLATEHGLPLPGAGEPS